MPRKNSINWNVADPITAVRLNHINSDIDDLYQYGDDRGRISEAVSETALKIDIGEFAFKIGETSGLYAGGTDISVTDDQTNYVEIDSAGVIQINTSSWTVAYARLGKVIVASEIITSIELWKPDVTGGQVEVQTSLTKMLGETGTVGLVYSTQDYEQTGVGTSNDIGTIAQPGAAQSFYAQGDVPITTIKLNLKKIASPTDNVVVEIQTDDGTGKPSGSVVVNGTSDNIPGMGLTTGFVETTANWSSIPSVTDGLLYHYVTKRSGTDENTNYYAIESSGSSAVLGTMSTYNGSVWANVSDDLYFKITGYNLLYKGGTNSLGILQESGTAGQLKKVNLNYDNNQSNLIIGKRYGYNAITGVIESGTGFLAISTTEIAKTEKNATEIDKGIIEIADTTEATTGTDDEKAMTPKKVQDVLEERLLVIPKSITLSRAPNAASATVTYNHDLGIIPSNIVISAIQGDAGACAASSYGTWVNNGINSNKCRHNRRASTIAGILTKAVEIKNASNRGQSGVIKNVTTTQFDIVWSYVATGDGGTIEMLATVTP